MAEIKAGSVVKSMAGHDAGRFYIVLSTEDDFAYIADGKLRKLDKPKRKNNKHLRPTNTVADLSIIKTDKKLRLNLIRFNSDENNHDEGGNELV